MKSILKSGLQIILDVSGGNDLNCKYTLAGANFSIIENNHSLLENKRIL